MILSELGSDMVAPREPWASDGREEDHRHTNRGHRSDDREFGMNIDVRI